MNLQKEKVRGYFNGNKCRVVLYLLGEDYSIYLQRRWRQRRWGKQENIFVPSLPSMG